MFSLPSITPEGAIAAGILLLIFFIAGLILLYMKNHPIESENTTFKERVDHILILLKNSNNLDDVADAERCALRTITRAEIMDAQNVKEISSLNLQIRINWEVHDGKLGGELNLYSHIKSLDHFLYECSYNLAHFNNLNPNT